jgi:hypothetical protein
VIVGLGVDEFLDRIRASDSTIQDAFSDEAIKALYGSFPEHYKEALSKTYKTFDVNSFLRKWQEFINIDTFFYCRPLITLSQKIYNTSLMCHLDAVLAKNVEKSHSIYLSSGLM